MVTLIPQGNLGIENPSMLSIDRSVAPSCHQDAKPEALTFCRNCLQRLNTFSARRPSNVSIRIINCREWEHSDHWKNSLLSVWSVKRLWLYLFDRLFYVNLRGINLGLQCLLWTLVSANSMQFNIIAENTHHKGKYYCMANWFGFDQTRKAVVHTTKVKQLNPNKINRRPALGTVILSLKLVFSGGVLTLEEELRIGIGPSDNKGQCDQK